MKFPQNQTCCQINEFGCGEGYPIVPGTNPAIQTWNGQNFVISDGSIQNPITLPYLQQSNISNVQFFIGVTAQGTLTLVPISQIP